jgi:CNT family concentrative nucleoside transporter
LIRGFAWTFTRLMKVSGAESLCTAANIFVGVESAFTVRPHINEMTRSELCTVLTAGMATVASSVMALYVLFLRDRFPMIAGHLMSASVLSAPAAIVVSKVLLPENETPVTLGKSIHPHYEKESSVFEAIINASMAGAKMIVGIVALLIAVLGLVALLDLILGGIGGRFNAIAGIHVDWSFRNLLGYVFYPFTLICGVPLDDAMSISRIIGERLVVTEVTSYQDLAAAIAAGTVVHPRSIVIATYALCGFAHVASMAIFIGGFAVLAPQKMKLLSEVGFRALFAATLACLMTACVAGTFFSDSSMLLMGKP